MKKIIRQESGMTLVELLVSLVISSFIIAGVYGVYTVQKKSYTVQEQVAEMQQRLRSAMDVLTREIRMAGSNPDMESKCSVRIITADKNVDTDTKELSLTFNACNLDDAGTDYRIAVTFNSDKKKLYLTKYKDMVGEGNTSAIADGVDWFEMLYIIGYDNDGKPLPADVTTETGRDNIIAVTISLLIRSTYPDRKYTDTHTYPMASTFYNTIDDPKMTWTPPANDHYHRRLLITTIQLRNMLQ